ncbi:M1 family metallopeptidase [Clostridium botulinum]|nr:M1 family metallopeptidase [Clostridium botulinum]
MIKSTKFYTKVFVKTPIFILSLLFNMYIFIFQLKALDSSILEYTSLISYAMIASNLFFLVATSSIISKKLEIMEFLEKDKFKKYLIIILSGLIISIIMSIIPIIMILVFKNNNINFYFVVKGVLNFFIIWNLSNMISISLAASVAILLNRWNSLFISLFIYSIFPFYAINPLFKSQLINKFLNIYSDSTAIKTNILCDEIFNMSYICDKVFVLCLILLMLILVKILLNKKILDSIAFIIVIFFICITTLIGSNSVTYVHKYNDSNLSNVNYNINSYDMNINIDNKLKNIASICLDINGDTDSITFLLDDLFKVEGIKIDNAPVNFIHSNDKIVLDYKTNEKESINIIILYEGSVHVEDELGIDTFYCNKHVVNLTDSLYWYPCLYNNSLINYNIDIITSANIYSNLNVERQSNNLLSNKYKVKGTSSRVELFAGQYKEVVDNGIEYIIPSTYNLEDFKIKLNKKISYYLNKHEEELSKYDFELLKEKKYKKVIIGMSINTNSYIKISNDVLLINYI